MTQQEKTALLNEVIEKIKSKRFKYSGLIGVEYNQIREDLFCIEKEIQSLLPKEEPESTQEIKAGDWVDYLGNKHQVVHVDGHCAWIAEDTDSIGMVVMLEKLTKPTKTQEEMDREKVEEILHEMDTTHHSCRKDLIIQAINYGRNTKQK